MAAVKTSHTSNGRLGWIKTDPDNKIYVALENAALNLICQYAVAAVGMTDEEIFHVPLQGIICSVQTFAFNKLTTKIKERLVILEDVSNLWTVNLKAYNNYNPRTPPPFSPLQQRSTF